MILIKLITPGYLPLFQLLHLCIIAHEACLASVELITLGLGSFKKNRGYIGNITISIV